MKTKGNYIISIILCLTLLLIGCESKTTKENSDIQDDETTQTTNIGSDTIEYLSTDDVSKHNIIKSDLHAEFLNAYSSDIKSLSENCESAVIGEITDIKYGVSGQLERTALTITIKEDLKGSLKTNDTIQIWTLGGYINKEQYKSIYGEYPENTTEGDLIEILYDLDEAFSIGDIGLFYIATGNETIMDCDYSLCLGGNGYFKYIKNEDTNARTIENREEKFTYDELINYFN